MLRSNEFRTELRDIHCDHALYVLRMITPHPQRNMYSLSHRFSSLPDDFPKSTSTEFTCQQTFYPSRDTTNIIFSAMEIFVTCLWIATVALLSWECQTWDAAEDVVSDVLSTEQAAMLNSLPNQDSGILSLRAATALASINCVFWAVTLFICKFEAVGGLKAKSLPCSHLLTYKFKVRRVLLYSVDSWWSARVTQSQKSCLEGRQLIHSNLSLILPRVSSQKKTWYSLIQPDHELYEIWNITAWT